VDLEGMAFSVVVALVVVVGLVVVVAHLDAPVEIMVIAGVNYAETADETADTKCVLHMDRHADFVKNSITMKKCVGLNLSRQTL
jgi:hypothetical protein